MNGSYERPGPIVELLKSFSLRALDLSNNPLFDLKVRIESYSMQDTDDTMRIRCGIYPLTHILSMQHHPIVIDEKLYDTDEDMLMEDLSEVNSFFKSQLPANSPYNGPDDEKEKQKMRAVDIFAEALAVSDV